VINLQFDNAPPPDTATEEERDADILGVILLQQYSLKKGTELFGDQADAADKKELTQINNLEKYQPILASSMSWEGEKSVGVATLRNREEKR
jgi:hypothetical protein